MPYDKQPSIQFAAGAGKALEGWSSIAGRIDRDSRGFVVVECYPGANVSEIESAFRVAPGEVLVIRTADLMLDTGSLDTLLRSFLTNDRVFGHMAPFNMADLFSPDALASAKAKIEAARSAGKSVLVIGTGAALLKSETSYLVYADMPRWEIQKRMRAGLPNLTANNPKEDILVKYKRAFFIEWRIADRWKMSLFDAVDLFIDTTIVGSPRAVDGATMREAINYTVTRPFRVMPYFDAGVWGGQWMKNHFDLPDGPPNYAWGFDCVPEENSLLIDFGDIRMEVPSINVVLRQPEALLGPKVYSRFGPEFPIRFDFLDTIGGGNLSLQVHPLTGYARDKFGIAYTQDESYYILQSEGDAAVYLGFKDGVTKDEFFGALETAQSGGDPLDVEKYVNRWTAKKHDHFSIPAGTIHCSGDGTLVLEISATPYIFTFKLWDWGRVGMDGFPRPVHAEHGKAVLQESRDTSWARREVIDRVDVLSDGAIREERTGLHGLEFIETRRHWFDGVVTHSTEGSVHVLNLVEGDEIIVESPDGAFEPFKAGYAETFIVPAAVGTYTIRPTDLSRKHATIRASVRI